MNVNVVDLQNSTAFSKIGQPGSGTKLGKDEFLQLLITQLGGQNPLDPVKNEDFIAQLTGFANLEELQNVGASMNDLLRMTSAGNAANAVSLLGKEVRIAGNEIKGPNAKIHYELPENAKTLKIEVRTAKDNRVVKVIENVPMTKGRHDLAIDELPTDEDLKFYVVGENFKDEEIVSQTSVSEFVDGANFATAIPILLVRSGRQIAATDIVEIHMPREVGE